MAGEKMYRVGLPISYKVLKMKFLKSTRLHGWCLSYLLPRQVLNGSAQGYCGSHKAARARTLWLHQIELLYSFYFDSFYIMFWRQKKSKILKSSSNWHWYRIKNSSLDLVCSARDIRYVMKTAFLSESTGAKAEENHALHFIGLDKCTPNKY